MSHANMKQLSVACICALVALSLPISAQEDSI
jgi:hypothetical protein